MNIINAKELARLCGVPLSDNLVSVHEGLVRRGKASGLNHPVRLSAFMAQLEHESAGFRYDQEIWGPTATQKRYEGRKDLGNTQPGDGAKFKGHGPLQITGRYNTGKFMEWCKAEFGSCPDFLDNPELINTDPWEGISAVWYWETHQLNEYADANHFIALTKRINGGTNGITDRERQHDEFRMRMLGFENIGSLQSALGLKPDGICGSKTRAAMHKKLSAMKPVRFTQPSTVAALIEQVLDGIADFFLRITKKG